MSSVNNTKTSSTACDSATTELLSSSRTDLDQLPLVDEDAEVIIHEESQITNGRTLADRYHLNADGSIESAESSCANGSDTPPAEQLCKNGNSIITHFKLL